MVQRIIELCDKSCAQNPWLRRVIGVGQTRFAKESVAFQKMWDLAVLGAQDELKIDMGRRLSIEQAKDPISPKVAKKTTQQVKSLEYTGFPDLVKRTLENWEASLIDIDGALRDLDAPETTAPSRLNVQNNISYVLNALRLITGQSDPASSDPVEASILERIVKGTHTEGYDFTKTPDYNIAGDPGHPFGSGRGGALKMALLATHATLMGKDTPVSVEMVLHDIFGDKKVTFAQESALPAAFDPQKLIKSRNPFFMAGGKSFMTIHNGFSRGAYYGEKVSIPSVFGIHPDDEGSFVARAIGCPQMFTLRDMVLVANVQHFLEERFENFDNSPKVKALFNIGRSVWEEDIKGQNPHMKAVYDYLRFLSPNPDLATVRPGDIYVRRSYPSIKSGRDKTYFNGTRGNTGIVLGFLGETGKEQVVVLGADGTDDNDVLSLDTPFPLGGVDGSFLLQLFPARSTVEEDGSRQNVYYAKPTINLKEVFPDMVENP